MLATVYGCFAPFFVCVCVLKPNVIFLCVLIMQRNAADQILRDLQNNPDMWLQVMHILQNTQNLNTKFFALQVGLFNSLFWCFCLCGVEWIVFFGEKIWILDLGFPAKGEGFDHNDISL